VLHGRPSQTPVALIRWGTRSEQQVLQGTLADIAELASKHAFKAPAITIVGEVVNLREKLAWFDRRPLFGKGILVTRAADQAGEFGELLRSRGASVFECPTISLIPPVNNDPLDTAIGGLAGFDWAIFTSVNAVQFFFARLAALGLDSRALGSCRVCAVGPKTAASLAPHGIRPDLVPPDYKAEGVVAEIRRMNPAGLKILYPRADKARDVIPKELEAMGATVTAPIAYRNVLPEEVPATALRALEQRQIHCVTFTSSSTVENLAALLGENRFLHLLEGVAVAVIGPITARTCLELGLKIDIQPREYTLAAMTEAIVNFFH